MRAVKFAILIAAALGCAPNSPFAIGNMTAEELKTVPDMALCRAAAYVKSDPIAREIEARDLLSEQDRGLIERSTVSVGMSSCAMWLVIAGDWGYRLDRTREASFADTMLVWTRRPFGSDRTQRMYTWIGRDGTVTNWSK